MVYHGTNQDFPIFDQSRLGQNTSAASSIAFFFTANPAEANEYADLAGRTQIADATRVEKKVKKLRSQIQRAESRGDWDTAERLYLEMEDAELGAINAEDSGQNVMPVYVRITQPTTLDMADSFDGHRVASDIKKAKKEKKDGLILKNAYDPVAHRQEAFSTTQFVAFSPTQIKSALGNTGAFDAKDAHINKAWPFPPDARILFFMAKAPKGLRYASAA